MNSVVDLATREERPPYVRFERRAIEDKPASLAAGQWVGKDVDYVKITPAYTKDVIVRDVDGWFAKMQQDERNGRIPNTWIPYYKRAYDAWKGGQEPPLDGTPIRGWLALSPADQERVCGANIHTVEDLAQATEDSLRRLGMGGVRLKNLAIATVKAASGGGKLAMENAELKAQLELTQQNLATVNEQLNTLKVYVRQNMPQQEVAPKLEATPQVEIGLSDIVEPAPASDTSEADEMIALKARYKEKFGEFPRGRITRETLISRLGA